MQAIAGPALWRMDRANGLALDPLLVARNTQAINALEVVGVGWLSLSIDDQPPFLCQLDGNAAKGDHRCTPRLGIASNHRSGNIRRVDRLAGCRSACEAKDPGFKKGEVDQGCGSDPGRIKANAFGRFGLSL